MKIEHANITVNDIEEATTFLKTALPSLTIRGEGLREKGGKWRHVGTEASYIALQQEVVPIQSDHQTYMHTGLNHLGLIVNNIEQIIDRLTDAGYQKNDAGVKETGRTSVYFYDHSGIEWEFVQYHSDDLTVCNQYQ